jgi:hypothetical protein
MFFKNLYNKLSRILLSVLILNLIFWNLLLVPAQTQACPDKYGNETKNCHSCNSAGECVPDSDGPYWCAKCFGKCTSSSGTDSTESSSGYTNPTSVLNLLTGLSDAAEGVEAAKTILINAIQKGEKIPEELKPWLISAIQNSGDLTETAKTTLIDIINKDGKIPADLKQLLISAIQGNLDITGLIKNQILEILMKGLAKIEDICASLAEIVAPIAVFGTTIGTPIAILIRQICPIILDEILTKLGFYEEKRKTGESTQTLPVPTLEYYQWEVGIPGFIKPGQYTKFK